ncbi:endonuclease/exonuclease/phosphatase family protein [Roseobacter sp. HKCCA0434]|uniref:endonuclease/exonuclease/phosphatase family protein n=1 Tax=Roseobacter sp. HKCCA0434 TaxID=3079297 RepID=UPI002905C1CF|nr:endonuclease/exonuclease/phosphatase family protein [Roseobacter sp. HKCCA0434]
MIAAFKTGLKVVGVLLLLLVLVACAQMYRNSGTDPLPPARDGALRVATYNVHYISARRQTGAWSLADWERRRDPLDAAFKHIAADLVAFQEMESHSGREADQDNLTLDFLLTRNPGYAAAAAGDPVEFPSTQPILYRTERLQMTDQGWFFFSTTPDIIYSRTFDGSYPAFASWAAFTDRATGAAFRAVNLHTDYASADNRLQSTALVAERIAPWIAAGETVLVLGDFNARLGAPTLERVEEVGITFAPVEGATYHFNRGLNLFGAIDHIGWSEGVRPVSEPTVIRQRFLGEWPTDHYPYLIDLALP